MSVSEYNVKAWQDQVYTKKIHVKPILGRQDLLGLNDKIILLTLSQIWAMEGIEKEAYILLRRAKATPK